MKTIGWKSILISGLFVLVGAAAAVAEIDVPPTPPSLCNGPANGILDGDEECETGPCCSVKCYLVNPHAACREAVDQCDAVEKCGEQSPAVDAACPADLPKEDGSGCEDGQFCTDNDTCIAGVCTAGPEATCDDGSDCTTDTCDEDHDHCMNKKVANGSTCDDGSACTSDTTCFNGECGGGTETVCEDDNGCTDDSCDPETGDCVFDNNTASCDDGKFCTTDDTCEDGACVGGDAPDCGDDDACTTDFCDTGLDECAHGTAADGTPCDDGQFCTVDDVCADGVCVGGGPNDCDDGNDCTADSCNEGADSCKSMKVANGSPCEDGNLCTLNDTCSMGECEAGADKECADESVCTDDSCDEATGDCVFTNNTAPCDDGLFCSAGDVCSAGACTAGPGNGCDDGNECTTEICDEETDGCTFENVGNGTACDDGQFCTLGDVCTDGACAGPTPRDCDDDNVCTKDSCNEGTDECKYSPDNNNGPCDDGSFCTVDDACHMGACEGAARDCADQNGCTDDSCNESTDTCDNLSNSAPCDDGNFCTTNDTCGGGTCSVFSPTCDDSNVCTDDSCNEEADSCSNVNNTAPCEDGNFCTVSDTCAGGTCGSGPARNCSDNNDCTNDSCNETTNVCDNVNNTNACDDGLFCTVNDVCSGGTCGGAARNCSDNNDCTNDVCNDTTDACTNPNNTNPCEDGQFCTSGDACSGGACVGGPPNLCSDSNGCTDDTCNETTNACDHVNNDDPCDSGVFCTVGGTCSGGSCVGTARNCSDNNDCTNDSCDEAGDACVNAPNSNACDDGLFCTVNDTCTLGTCLGSTRNCSDNNDCTSDTCNELGNACASVNNTAPCDDGQFCTVGDTCSNGSCVSGGPNSCDDENACTDDSCVEAGDTCLNANNTEDCTDFNSCTIGDVCAAGVCVPGEVEDPECVPTTTTTTTTLLGTTTTTTEECPVCGDFNGDCELTASDALSVLQAAVGLHECSLSVCDFSGDGRITALDALAVLRAAVGLPSTPLCPPAAG